GKTTLLKAVAGLVAPQRGEIRFAGRAVSDLEAPERVRLGLALVPGGRRLFSRLTVAENLTLGTFTHAEATHRREMLERVYTLFPALRERARQRAGTLSGGEGQMLAIARALMSRPRFLMLDEPSLGIMPRLVDAILEALARLHRGEGFVEAILRRAGYFVARVGRETQMPRLMKSGTDTYLPDLLAWRQENTGGEQGDTPLYRFVAVEVKYRWNPDDLLRRPVPLELADAHRQWPDFRVVLVTDHPPGGPFVFPSRQMER